MDNEQLKRIADAIEEILRLVKADQEKYTAREAREKLQSEQETRITNGQDLSWPRALARGPRTKLQGTSGKLQASSFRVDKTKLQGYSIL